jgi:hypothetical protein
VVLRARQRDGLAAVDERKERRLLTIEELFNNDLGAFGFVLFYFV